MNRAVLTKTKLMIAAAIIGGVGLSGSVAVALHSHADSAQLVANAQHQLTEIDYRGKNSVDALTLLRQHATITTKHYSFGDMVVSINGSTGNGPKYWTFYVNGHMAQVGAGAYVSKASDRLTWKLQ